MPDLVHIVRMATAAHGRAVTTAQILRALTPAEREALALHDPIMLGQRLGFEVRAGVLTKKKIRGASCYEPATR